MRYASLPHDLIGDNVRCDIPEELREAVVMEAEISCHKRAGRNPSWLYQQLEADYKQFAEWDASRAADEIETVSAYD
jgi:hypothetical protein